ncbi:hypothetical protein IRJ41_005575 [Triplophysa rosa]|uniref:Uncharacterized protein n=1 Tax=Triplophysa rosa TaxID=992332 RepID=A0A9W7WCI0_TRIRA|nr:hypothetical protein IRJ41_005575 [Triplophysa rosa]
MYPYRSDTIRVGLWSFRSGPSFQNRAGGIKSRAARVAKNLFPAAAPLTKRIELKGKRERAMKGRGRAEAEGGEKRAHASDKSTTNGSPP